MWPVIGTQSTIKELDVAAEIRDLSIAERDQLTQAREQQTKILCMREEACRSIRYYAMG